MQGLGCQAIICQTGSIKELIHLQRETGPVMSPSRQERGREMEIRLLGSQLTASFRSLWHPNSKGPVPFGAIYLYMGTTPNPAYIQFLHYGEQDGGGSHQRIVPCSIGQAALLSNSTHHREPRHVKYSPRHKGPHEDTKWDPLQRALSPEGSTEEMQEWGGAFREGAIGRDQVWCFWCKQNQPNPSPY